MDHTQHLDKHGAPRVGAPLGALVSAYARLAPNRSALTCGGETLTRAELEAASNRRARQLAALGVGQDDVVVVALPNGRSFYETVIAVWKLGATPAHVSNKLTHDEFAAILELAQARLVVDAATPEAAADLSDEPLPARVARAWKVSTSGGSTGRPKLVVDPNPAVWGEEKMALRRGPGAVVINPGPLYHSAPFGQMIPALCQGAHVVDMGRFDPTRWLELVEQHRADWVYLVPTMMARIARLPRETLARYDLSSIKTLVHMAAPCADWVKQAWIDLIGADAVWEIYGGTERFGSTMISGREWLERPGSVGRPRPGIEVRILDPEGRPLPAGQVGEIYFRRPGGPDSTFRYVGAEARRREDWASFGDLGRLDEGGYLYIVDRRTDMIVSGGVNFYPAEIEAAIETCPGVVASVVVGLPDDDLGQRTHAIVQLEPGMMGRLSDREVLEHLDRRLSKPKHPRSIEFTAEPVRDEAGKVRRAAWRARVLSPAA